MKCPFCSEFIPEKSANCPKCKENLNDKPQVMLSVEESNFLLNKYMDSIRREELFLLSTKKKWPKSRVILYCSLLFCVLAITGSFMLGVSSGVATCVIVCVPMALVIGYSKKDKNSFNIQLLADPKEFVKQYLFSLNENRAKLLFQIVAPLGRTKETKPLLFDKIKNDTNLYDISQLKGFCKYWKSTFRGTGNYSRSVVIEQINIAEEYNDKVILNITLNFTSYNTLLTLFEAFGPIFGSLAVHFGAKKETVEITKIILKHNNKWYIAEGELQGNLDFATFKK